MNILIADIQKEAYLGSSSLFNNLIARLPQSEQDRIHRFHFEKDRWLSLLGLLMMQSVHGSFDGFLRSELGKPYFANSEQVFSISHSGNVVICAFQSKLEFPKNTHATIGIDLEEIKPIDPADFHLVFLPQEIDRIKNDSDFYTLWTQKEAVMKALGTGFSLEPKELLIETNGICNYQKDTWFMKSLDLGKQYACTVCTAYKLSEMPKLTSFRPL